VQSARSGIERIVQVLQIPTEIPVSVSDGVQPGAEVALVSRYLGNVIAADRKMVAKVFHVLKWTPAELERTIAALLEEEAVREVEIGRVSLQLVSMHALRRGL
jgi:hypothetical protein